MPIHDWSRVDSGIFHAFHHAWIGELSRTLNRSLLPADYDALPEQRAAGFGPDVLALEFNGAGCEQRPPESPGGGDGSRAVLTAPQLQPTAVAEQGFYRRRQSRIAVRHASGDRVVAIVEIVSPGNKSSRAALRDFVAKAAELLVREINLLVLDVCPPGPRDPHGIHAEIWDEFTDESYAAPTGQPRTFAAYEAADTVCAYVLHAQLGEVLPDMPLFLAPQQAVTVPLEATCQAAFAELPRRWQDEIAT